jgi:hypothetical protein
MPNLMQPPQQRPNVIAAQQQISRTLPGHPQQQQQQGGHHPLPVQNGMVEMAHLQQMLMQNYNNAVNMMNYQTQLMVRSLSHLQTTEISSPKAIFH